MIDLARRWGTVALCAFALSACGSKASTTGSDDKSEKSDDKKDDKKADKKDDKKPSEDKKAEAEAAPTKPPFESLTIKATGKDSSGNFTFDVKNENTATIQAVFFQFYAYDADGKQIGSSDLSWNSDIKPGETTSVATFPSWEVAKTAASVDLAWRGLKFKGLDAVTDDKRTPNKKPKGEFPGGGGSVPSADSSAAPADSGAPAAGGDGLAAFAGDYITDYGGCSMKLDGEKIKGICPGRGTVLDCKLDGADLVCTWSESSGGGRARLKRDPATGRLNGSWGNGGSASGGGSWTFTPKKK